MARTKQQLAEAVLRRLNVVGAGETPTADDATLVKDMYADLYQEQEIRDISFWPETAIPEHIFRALVDYVAGNIAPDFGRIEYTSLADSGMNRLQRMAQEEYNGETQTAEYF